VKIINQKTTIDDYGGYLKHMLISERSLENNIIIYFGDLFPKVEADTLNAQSANHCNSI